MISSLAGLAHLSSLMELYIGNNEVHELPEVDHLEFAQAHYRRPLRQSAVQRAQLPALHPLPNTAAESA